MDYKDLLINRRSVRKYTDQEVAREVILSIIKESTYAPSSGNDQPWKFIIVTDKSLMKRISDEAKENLLREMASDSNHYAKRYQGMLQREHYHIFYHAPCVVFIIGERHQTNMIANCSLAASYLMMSAADRGLGTCWINFAKFIKSPSLVEALSIPDGCDIVAPITIGYPAHIPDMPKRQEPDIIRIF